MTKDMAEDDARLQMLRLQRAVTKRNRDIKWRDGDSMTVFLGELVARMTDEERARMVALQRVGWPQSPIPEWMRPALVAYERQCAELPAGDKQSDLTPYMNAYEARRSE